MGAALLLPEISHASVHDSVRLTNEWSGVSAVLQAPAASNEDIVHAAKLDLTVRRSNTAMAPIRFGRYLLVAMSDPRMRLQPSRGAQILQLFLSQSGPEAATFWSEFSLATLQQLAGDNRLVAATLARALQHAASDNTSPATVARTTGIMGHAQQAGGMPEQARGTFERLRSDPLEYNHAVIHLGELALSADGPDAGLEIWLKHSSGLPVGVTIVIAEADALWERDPETSYRLVTAAIARLRTLTQDLPDPVLETAVARLSARTRENAMSAIAVRVRRGRAPASGR
jgi:hypothetical protein